MVSKNLSPLIQSQQFYRSRTGSMRGFSLAETLVALAIAGVLATIMLPTFNLATNPLTDSSNRFSSIFSLARAKAMSKTSAYRIRPTSTTQFIVEFSNICTADPSTWKPDGSFVSDELKFDSDVQLSAATENNASRAPGSGWSLCFNSRGIADKNLVVTLQNTKNSKQRPIEVFPGGSVQVGEEK
jgi:type IV fimbrial biogenesis protein FimT